MKQDQALRIPAASPPFWAWYGLAVMMLVSMAGNAIPPILALLTDAVKRDLSLSDTQIGALRGIATTLVVAIAAFPIAWVADRVDRRLVFAVCMLLWASATVGIGFADSYAMLFALSIGLAFGEAVLGPVTFAIIPDLFAPERRLLANSIFFVSQLLGQSAALILGGWLILGITGVHGSLPFGLAAAAPWRPTIIAAALPTLALIPLVLMMRVKRTVAPRSAASEGAGNLWPYLRAHGPTLFPLFIGFSLIGCANFTAFGWLSVVIMRSFSLSPATVGVELGQVFAVSSITGVVLANLLARWLSRGNSETAPVRVAQLGALVAVVSSVLYLFARSPIEFYAVAALQLAASFGGLVLSPTVTQSIAPAQLRARMFAIAGVFYIGFGAISPLLVGLISDSLGADPRSLLYSMLAVALPAFVLGTLTLQFAVRHLGRTIEAAKEAP